MKTRTLLIAAMSFTFLASLFGGSAVDLSTPERAVKSLEDAWRAKDIEKAIRCKDFRGEAEQMLRDKPAAVRTEDIIAQTAQVLELGYRAEIKKSGFPKMQGCHFHVYRDATARHRSRRADRAVSFSGWQHTDRKSARQAYERRLEGYQCSVAPNRLTRRCR